MMEKISNYKIVRESSLFEEFIRNAFLEQQIETISEGRPFDLFLPFGLKNYCELPCDVEIKYSNNKQIIEEFAFSSFHRSNRNLIIISFCDDIEYDIFQNKKIIFLGKKFIFDLAKKCEKSWWNFLASCSNSPTIKIDYAKNVLYLEEFELSPKNIRVSASLNINEINNLSLVNEKNFIIERNKNNTSVIIGNGVSIPFGSDSWNTMSDYLFDYLSPMYLDNKSLVKKTIGDNNLSCTELVKQLLDSKKYKDAIHQCIYRKYEKEMHVSGTLLNEIVRSKLKFSNLNLITYNYDCFLEREYSKVAGSTLTSVTSEVMDKKVSEPKIKHIHGFMDYKSPSTSTGIILTQDDYYSTYSSKCWTVDVQKSAFDGLTLFVGSSMSDVFQMKLIDEYKNFFYKKSENQGKIWKCYALLCFKDLSPKDIASIYQFYLKKNIYIIYADDFAKLGAKYRKLFS